MPTIEIIIEDELLSQLDEVATERRLSRDDFLVIALKNYLDHLKIEVLERQHREGYLKYPQQDEVIEWTDEQVWGDME